MATSTDPSSSEPGPGPAERRLVAAVGLLEALVPSDPFEVSGWRRYEQLGPHITAMAGHLADVEPARAAVLFGNLGIVQQQLGRFEEAETNQKRALGINEAVYGPDHHQVAATLVNLGNVQQDLGRFEEAKTNLTRALPIFEAVYGPDHPNTQTGTTPR